MTGGYGKPSKYYAPLLALQKKEFNLGYVNLGWPFIEPEQGIFNWKPGDGDLQVAIDGHMTPTAGLLIWGRDAGGGLPSWVRNGGFSRDELIEVIRKRVRDVMTRYKGRFEWYEVVNEAYAEPNSPPDLLLERIGPEYIEMAFETARQTDPNVKLLYNDYANHTLNGSGSTRTGITKSISGRLKANGLIDAVGVEMGLSFPDIPTRAEVVDALRSYSVPTIVTEFSVRIANLVGTKQERFARQAEIYRDMLAAAIESGNCNEFIAFQVVDMLSGWEDPAQSDATASPLNDPTPFDDDFQPKPAYFAMRDVLRSAALRR
jgi:endo-1,4-beta-xylanase